MGFENLQDGAVINLDETDLSTTDQYKQLSLSVNTIPLSTGSVQMSLKGPKNVEQSDNFFPYALYGDHDGDYQGGTLPTGKYIFTATPYSEPNLQGSAGEPRSVTFTVIDKKVAYQPQPYQQLQKLLAHDPEKTSQFGYIISVSGNTLAIVSPPFLPEQEGAVYIYKKTPTGWKVDQKVKPNVNDSELIVRGGIGISDHWMMIGAEAGDATVFVFQKQASGWKQVQQLSVPADSYDNFGRTIVMTDDQAIIGDATGTDGNTIFVYERTSSGWQQTNTFSSPEQDSSYYYFYGDAFGFTFSFSGNYAIVGDAGNSEKGESAGAAYVYKKTSSGWQRIQKITASDAAPYSVFGASIAMDGDYAVVGATNAGGYGKAYIFKRTASGWKETTRLRAFDKKTGGGFGRDISIRGNQIAISATVLNGQIAEAVYLAERKGSSWVETAKLSVPGDPADFGRHVLLTDQEVLVSAPEDHENTKGAVYVFGKGGDTDNEISSVQLVDASTNQAFATIKDGASFDLAKFPASNFNIQVQTGPHTSSVYAELHLSTIENPQ